MSESQRAAPGLDQTDREPPWVGQPHSVERHGVTIPSDDLANEGVARLQTGRSLPHCDLTMGARDLTGRDRVVHPAGGAAEP